VFIIPNSEKNKPSETKTVTISCINDQPGLIIPIEPTFKNGVPSCGVGTTQIIDYF
jgi:hypothetical protein